MARRTDIIGVIDATGAEISTEVQTITDVASAIPTAMLTNRKAITIFNNSQANTIYIGKSTVTSSNGYPILPQGSLPFDLGSGGTLYGICATGQSAEIRTLQIDNA